MDGTLQTRRLGGVRVAVIDRAGLVDRLLADADRPPAVPRLVFSANGHALSWNARDPAFADALVQADILHADGQPLVLFSRVWPGPAIPERSCTTDWFHDAAAAAAGHGLRFFLLGGDDSTNEAAARVVADRYGDRLVAGRHHGYFTDEQVPTVLEQIRQAAPHVVWVGLGRPRQETFCCAVRDRLGGVAWLKTCGGLFGYLAGRERRAPVWMQRSGLEWLYRLGQDPSRLAGRYLATNLHAAGLLITRSHEG